MAVDADTLENFIEDSGLSFKKNSVSFIFECPRCCKRDKLYIRRRDGQFVCWVCAESDGFRGRAEFALSELLSMPIREVCEALYGAVDVVEDMSVFDFDFGQEEDAEDAERPLVPQTYPFDYHLIDHPHAKRGLEYLEGRGIPRDIAIEYGLRYCPGERRVVFPIEVDGVVLGWQKRIVIPNRIWNEDEGKFNEVPKILSSKNVPRDRVLMFQDRLKGSDHAVLCEGPIDAIKCHEAGGNVCTMGKIVSSGQIDVLRRSGVKKMYLALDADAASESARALSELNDVQCYLLQAPAPYKDLGEMPMSEVKALFDSAPLLSPSHLFLFLRQ